MLAAAVGGHVRRRFTLLYRCPMATREPATVFLAFRDSPQRRAALRAAPGSPERYLLFGLDDIAARGVRVRHNLEAKGPSPLWARALGRVLNRLLRAAGGYGGDFATVVASLRSARAADLIVSTVDTVGIPLVLVKSVGLLPPPVVYTAIGLPERLVRLRGKPMRRLYASALRRTRVIVAFAESEAAWLRSWIGPGSPPVVFRPFGVDVDAFRPPPYERSDFDVLSVGADPRRDFGLLAAVAARHPELDVRIVTTLEHMRSLGRLPANLTVETDLPLVAVRARLASARVVALPVQDNSYSGATTVLLQAMAMARPVVVSRTEAIAHGYELQDGVNCRLVPPGDAAALEEAVLGLLADPAAASRLGARARETAERSFSWDRHADALWDLLAAR
jgi:glycosyltransferase involved in cell wall biosynthesis